jgi:broad specificity phosphatase PhoE
MAQIFIYLRHGAYDSKVRNKDTEPLQPLGERQAAEAGVAIRGWLEDSERGIDRVVWTGKRRTFQTAELAVGAIAPPVGRWVERSSARGLEGLFGKIDAWREDLPDDAVLLFSGHGGNYAQLCRWCGEGVHGKDRDHGSVLIFARVDGAWSHRLAFTPADQREQ